MRWVVLLFVIAGLAGCVDAEPSPTSELSEDAGESASPGQRLAPVAEARVEPVEIVMEAKYQADCVVMLCFFGGGGEETVRVAPHETIINGSLTLEVANPPPWVDGYAWRLVCDGGPRDCAVGGATGDPPFRLDVPELPQGSGLTFIVEADAPPGAGATVFIPSEVKITGSLSVSPGPMPDIPVIRHEVTFDGNGPQCLPAADPDCTIIGAGSIHYLPAGEPHRIEVTLSWDDPTASELEFRLQCSPPGTCVQDRKVVAGPSPLTLEVDLWDMKGEHLTLTTAQNDGPLLNWGTRPAYEIRGAYWTVDDRITG